MVQAVVFDIGGVLKLTPPTGWRDRWREQRGIPEEQFDGRLRDLARSGSVGEISYEYYVEQVQARLGLDATATDAFMDDLWAEYLGTPNTELIDFLTGLRGRVRTGILSNGFVGAREREQERYGFVDDLAVCIQGAEDVGMTGVLHRDNATTIGAVEATLGRWPADVRRHHG